MKTKLPKLAPVVPPWLAIWCRMAGWPLPVMEFKFAIDRDFAFDFAWPSSVIKQSHGLAIEVEGGIYGRGKACPVCKRKPVGAHSSIQRLLSDMEKYNLAATMGWRVIRVRPEECEDGSATVWLDRVRSSV